MLILLGIAYQSNEAIDPAEKIMQHIEIRAEESSAELADKQGPQKAFFACSRYRGQRGYRFNILFVLGISSTIKPLPLQPGSNTDIGMVVFASFLLFGFMFTGKRRSLDRWEGAILLVSYAAYVVFLILKQ